MATANAGLTRRWIYLVRGPDHRVKFLVASDGFGALTGMFVDDVQLTLPCGSISPTPALASDETAPDAEAAPLGSLEMLRRELARGSPAPRLRWLADSKGLVFRLPSVCALEGLCEHWLPLFKEPGP